MTLQFTVSPDFPADRISGWYVFNTWMQKTLNTGIHLDLYDNFQRQREAISAGKVDMIYANPYDASMLVRNQRFAGIARPRNQSDEVVVAVPAAGAVKSVEELAAGTRIASTDDPDIDMMGMILLEPADLGRANTTHQMYGTYVLVAKALMKGDADVGFFLADAYHKFSPLIREQLRPLVTSKIDVVKHVFMLGPRAEAFREPLLAAMTGMGGDSKGQAMLQSLGFDAWDAVDHEDVEFMIDLIDTLVA